MFTHIRTSKKNKELVSLLTREHSLGAENVIARIAIAYSLEQGRKLDLSDLKDSGGKEYSRAVLLGDKDDIYIGMICSFYGIHRSNQDLGKYVKMHLDIGLESLKEQNTILNVDPIS
jgi:DNA sulfur modification protein DndE